MLGALPERDERRQQWRHLLSSDGSVAVRRAEDVSTDGWQFSGDAVRFSSGRTAAAVRSARKALSAAFKSEAQRRS